MHLGRNKKTTTTEFDTFLFDKKTNRKVKLKMIPNSEGRSLKNIGGNGPRWKIFIVEKNDKEVSHCWKNLQILTYVLVIVCGIASSKSMGDVSYMFSNKCIFNATLITEMGVNGTRFISSDNFDIVRWGEPSDCDFSQFYPVFSMACAGFLATFFAMCGRGGDTTRNLPQPWRMVPIAFVFNCICLIVSCVHVAYVYNGFTLFCKNIHPINDAAKLKSCDDLFHAKVKNADGDLAANIAGAQVFSVFGLIGWMLGLVVLIIRCATHADFHVMAQRVDAESYTKKLDYDDEVFASTSSEYSTPLTSINY